MLNQLIVVLNQVRPIIKLGSRAVYKSGDGTLDNPYEVKFYNEK